MDFQHAKLCTPLGRDAILHSRDSVALAVWLVSSWSLACVLIKPLREQAQSV